MYDTDRVHKHVYTPSKKYRSSGSTVRNMMMVPNCIVTPDKFNIDNLGINFAGDYDDNCNEDNDNNDNDDDDNNNMHLQR
jgi:hypothetical protein